MSQCFTSARPLLVLTHQSAKSGLSNQSLYLNIWSPLYSPHSIWNISWVGVMQLNLVYSIDYTVKTEVCISYWKYTHCNISGVNIILEMLQWAYFQYEIHTSVFTVYPQSCVCGGGGGGGGGVPVVQWLKLWAHDCNIAPEHSTPSPPDECMRPEI